MIGAAHAGSASPLTPTVHPEAGAVVCVKVLDTLKDGPRTVEGLAEVPMASSQTTPGLLVWNPSESPLIELPVIVTVESPQDTAWSAVPPASHAMHWPPPGAGISTGGTPGGIPMESPWI